MFEVINEFSSLLEEETSVNCCSIFYSRVGDLGCITFSDSNIRMSAGGKRMRLHEDQLGELILL